MIGVFRPRPTAFVHDWFTVSGGRQVADSKAENKTTHGSVRWSGGLGDEVALQQAGRDNCGSRGRRLSSNGLTYFEALKFRMLKIERPSCLVSGTRVRGTKCFRFGPCLESPLALPHGMRGVERMVPRLWPFE